jgi:hypothetical protein
MQYNQKGPLLHDDCNPLIPSHRTVFIDRTAWSAPFPTIQTSSCRTAYLRARVCSSLPLRMLYEAYSCTYARYRHHIPHICCSRFSSVSCTLLYSTLLHFSCSSLLSLTLFMNHSPISSLSALPPSPSFSVDPCGANPRSRDPHGPAPDIQREDEVHPAARGHRHCRLHNRVPGPALQVLYCSALYCTARTVPTYPV